MKTPETCLLTPTLVHRREYGLRNYVQRVGMPRRKASYFSSSSGVMKGMELDWPGACILDSTSSGSVSLTLFVSEEAGSAFRCLVLWEGRESRVLWFKSVCMDGIGLDWSGDALVDVRLAAGGFNAGFFGFGYLCDVPVHGVLCQLSQYIL